MIAPERIDNGHGQVEAVDDTVTIQVADRWVGQSGFWRAFSPDHSVVAVVSPAALPTSAGSAAGSAAGK